MKLYEQPVDSYENKFVITEDRAYFLPYLNRAEVPPFIEILEEIFNLDDPDIYREVEDQLDEGRVILGYYDPSTKEVVIHVPLEPDEYVQKRIGEVFGDV